MYQNTLVSLDYVCAYVVALCRFMSCGGKTSFVVCVKTAAMVWCAPQCCLTNPNTWARAHGNQGRSICSHHWQYLVGYTRMDLLTVHVMNIHHPFHLPTCLLPKTQGPSLPPPPPPNTQELCQQRRYHQRCICITTRRRCQHPKQDGVVGTACSSSRRAGVVMV